MFGFGQAKPRIFLVDDNREFADALKRFLDSQGLPTTAMYSPDGLRELLSDRPPSAIILDLTLGDISGIDFMPEIRESWPYVPIFIVSGPGYKDKYMEYAYEMGAQGYISKSVPPQEIMAAVTRVLENPKKHRSTERIPKVEDL
jgi:DNA-binding response OmpR family regulator